MGRALLGLLLAAGAFTLTFGGPRQQFWQRMTYTGLSLGSFALASEPSLRRPRLSWRDGLVGVAIAAGLYGVFQVGDRLARLIMPRGSQEIGDIYALRALRPKLEIAARLAIIIGPAEELFWRAHLQRRFMDRFGRWPGTLLEVGCYGGVHLAARNPTLMAAATVAGLAWSILSALGVPTAALIVSHVAWDVWIFLVAPTQTVDDRG